MKLPNVLIDQQDGELAGGSVAAGRFKTRPGFYRLPSFRNRGCCAREGHAQEECMACAEREFPGQRC
jgi:hypothetical protein